MTSESLASCFALRLNLSRLASRGKRARREAQRALLLDSQRVTFRVSPKLQKRQRAAGALSLPPSHRRDCRRESRRAPARGRRSSKAGRLFKAGSAGDVRTPNRGRSPPSAAGARPWRRPGGLLGAGGGSFFLTRKRFPCTAIGCGRDGNAEILGNSHAESWSWRLYAELLKCRLLCFVVVAFCDAKIFTKSSRRGFQRFLEYLV